MTFDWTYSGPDVSYSLCKRVEYKKYTGGGGTTMNGSCSAGTYSLKLTGLEPSTRYEYRAAAAHVSECGGTCVGEYRTFRTLPILPATLSMEINAVTDEGALVSVRTNSLMEGCWLDIGSSTNYGRRISAIPCSPDEASTVRILDLAPATTYNVRLGGRNIIGESYSDNVVFTTPATLTPTTLKPSDLTPFSATLRGVLNPKGAPGQFLFQYGVDEQYGNTTASYPFSGSRTAIEASAPTSVALIPGRTYHYRIVAANKYGTWAGQDQAFVTPTTTDKPSPSSKCRAAKKTKVKAQLAVTKARKAKSKKALTKAKRDLAKAKRRVKQFC